MRRAWVLLVWRFSGCDFLFPDVKGEHHYGGGSTKPSPEPSVGKAAYDMISQTYSVIVSHSGERLAARRCRYVDGSTDACEITFFDRGVVLEQVPTYRRGYGEWEVQAKHATNTVARAIEKHFGRDHVALDRRGIYGMRPFSEGELSASIVGDEIRLGVVRGRQLAATKLPVGVTFVRERYVSMRAPDLYVVALEAGNEVDRDRREGYVVFRLPQPGNIEVVQVMGPLTP